MFDNLFNLVKEHAGDAITNNPAVPNEKNEEVTHAATTSIMDTLKAQVSSGNLSHIMDMFKGGSNVSSSSISSAAHGNVITDLMSKFGMDNAQASSVASGLVPKVMESFVNKTNDPNDKSFDLQDIVKNIGGSGGIGGMLGGLGNLFK
jgi:hypothetical protein